MTRSLPRPRPSQARILDYREGRMGVSAVPGSGKTWTLSLLAARLVQETPLARGQQILVVTLVNAARGKFEQQVREFLGEQSLGTLYRVRTLHGLAKDIVSERPSLVGLSDEFEILDEKETEEILQDAVRTWFRGHPTFGIDEYFPPQTGERSEQILHSWKEREVPRMAKDFIQRAKDYRLRPAQLQESLRDYPRLLPLAEMSIAVYEDYERALRYRGAVDFQDLIRLALEALEADEGYRTRLRARWPVILEDEAQDSSQLQEAILRRLVGETGNWVRVGDPNQAIYETFTTASPEFLRRFLVEPGVKARELPESGRSAPSIIRLANRLIAWSTHHPREEVRQRTPLTGPTIRPLAEGNPEDCPGNIEIHLDRKMTAVEERDYVAGRIAEWLPGHSDRTLAVLVPTNKWGAEMSKVLRARHLPVVEMLKTTISTRQVAGALYRILGLLVQPTSSAALADGLIVWKRGERDSKEVKEAANHLRQCRQVETYLAPRERDWLRERRVEGGGPGVSKESSECLQGFRERVQVWQKASLLPIDQLILTIAADLFSEAAELATAYSIALTLQRTALVQPRDVLRQCHQELREIATNNRKFVGLADDGDQFDPSRYPGQVVLMTHHGAKGLEWDRVHLTSVNNYDFPSGDPHDIYQGEVYYLRDRLNPQAEALAQLKALKTGVPYRLGEAGQEARIDYAAERLRLLYVGLTRARRELIITWNTGRMGNLQPARPLHALAAWLTDPRAWEGEATPEGTRQGSRTDSEEEV
jgi:DNA helicase-2/ATP-dependent DNA helicase PcrA